MRALSVRSGLVLALLLACGKSEVKASGALADSGPVEETEDGGVGADGGIRDDAAAGGWPDFAPPGPGVKVQAGALIEASGLVVSARNPGVLWSHNDSGDQARIFALRADGSLVGVVKLTGALAVDWEDIALAPGADGNDELFIGDIGDNAEKRTSIFAYRIAEPDLTASVPTEITSVAIELVYGDGKAHNAETLLVDPRDGSIVIVTKVVSGASEIFFAAPPFAPGVKTSLTKVGAVRIDPAQSSSPLVTGGTITRAGDLILLRTYTSVLAFPRAAGQSIASALGAKPCPLPAALEEQGEAVALTPEGSGFYTLSEGASPPLSFSKRR